MERAWRIQHDGSQTWPPAFCALVPVRGAPTLSPDDFEYNIPSLQAIRFVSPMKPGEYHYLLKLFTNDGNIPFG